MNESKCLTYKYAILTSSKEMCKSSVRSFLQLRTQYNKLKQKVKLHFKEKTKKKYMINSNSVIDAGSSY